MAPMARTMMTARRRFGDQPGTSSQGAQPSLVGWHARLQKLKEEHAVIGNEGDEVITAIHHAASLCMDGENDELIESLKGALATVLRTQTQAQKRTEFLEEQYRVSHMPGFDVEKQVEDVEGLAQDHGIKKFNHKRHAKWIEFCGTIGDVTAGAGADAEDADADLVCMATQQQNLAVNKRCPLTGKSIMELDDPVRDKRGYVYEKAPLLEYIKRKGQYNNGRAACPVAGAEHMLEKKDITSAHMLIAAIKRSERANRNAEAGAADDVQDL